MTDKLTITNGKVTLYNRLHISHLDITCESVHTPIKNVIDATYKVIGSGVTFSGSAVAIKRLELALIAAPVEKYASMGKHYIVFALADFETEINY